MDLLRTSLMVPSSLLSDSGAPPTTRTVAVPSGLGRVRSGCQQVEAAVKVEGGGGGGVERDWCWGSNWWSPAEQGLHPSLGGGAGTGAEEGGSGEEEGGDQPVEDLPVPARDGELTLEKTTVMQ